MDQLRLPDHIHDLELLAQGGMGAVFKARHRLTGARLAVKVMLPELAKDANHLQRFIQEAKLVCKLSNPHIVAIHECAIMGNTTPYMVMDFVEGETLKQRLDREPSLTVKEAVDIFSQAADALLHAHKKGVIHRDLKPANMMLTKSDDGETVVKVLDFGLAKVFDKRADEETLALLTATGEVLGTPYYMSPEQVMDDPLDQRTDVYSLGCVMYHVMTGVVPYPGTSALQVLSKHAHDPLPNMDDSPRGAQCPPSLKRIILKCLEKDISDRYASMDELQRDLIQYRDSGTVRRRITGKEKRSASRMIRGVITLVVSIILGYVLMKALGGDNP
ncbi:MAG: serine/threonine protein kinase [Candidatus Obscuribacterales bacterium]|nr:serine/threonine protein kinase [Candidatus Obscuribacterales bacterium]